MPEQAPLLSALFFVGVSVGLGTLVFGIRRIPWRYAALFGAGYGLVFATAYVASSGRLVASFGHLVDPGMLVLVGAFGGGLAQLAFERGERERRRISDAITAVREVHFT